jgi:hypothetical protein
MIYRRYGSAPRRHARRGGKNGSGNTSGSNYNKKKTDKDIFDEKKEDKSKGDKWKGKSKGKGQGEVSGVDPGRDDSDIGESDDDDDDYRDELTIYPISRLWGLILIFITLAAVRPKAAGGCMFHLSMALTLALTSLTIDFSSSQIIFHILSTFSWFCIFDLYMNTVPGVSITTMVTDAQWILGFLLNTAIVIRSQLPELVTNMHDVYLSTIGLSFLIAIHCFVEHLAKQGIVISYHLVTLDGTSIDNIPLRLHDFGFSEEASYAPWFWLIYLGLLCLGHLLAWILLYSLRSIDAALDARDAKAASDKKASSNSLPRYFDPSKAAEEIKSEDYGDIPSDSVEISQEEAIRLVDKGKRSDDNRENLRRRSATSVKASSAGQN